MILGVKRGTALVFFAAIFLLPSQFVLSSEAPSEEEGEEADGAIVLFKITSPAIRNPLPADILDGMRKELMVLMGVEPTESDEPAKKTGH